MTPLLAQRLRPDRSFERIYERHVADVYRYTLAVLRNPADAEDVTQTTFMNAYRAFKRGERPRSAQNWLIAIAHNVCRQRFRQSQRRVEEVTFDENVAEALDRDDDAPSAEDIQRALGHLAFNQRSALVMRELEGRSYGEIAEILGVSTSAVETLIFRARRALREQLEGALTCPEAELAISRQLDGRLPRGDRGRLRAHLRECEACAALARKQRAQRSAIRALAAVPLPSSLTALGSLFGGGAATGGAAAALGGGVAAKAAAVVAVGALAGGGVYEGVTRAPWRAAETEPRREALVPVPPGPAAGALGGASAPPVEPAVLRSASVPPRLAKPGRVPTARAPAAKTKAKPKAKAKAKAKTEKSKAKTETKAAPPRGQALGRTTAPPAAVQQGSPAGRAPKLQRKAAPVDRPRPARTQGRERTRQVPEKPAETPTGRGRAQVPRERVARGRQAPRLLRVPEPKPKK